MTEHSAGWKLARKLYMKKWRENNREYIRKWQRAWIANNPDAIKSHYKSRRAKWSEGNRERANAVSRKHYHAHKSGYAAKHVLLRWQCITAYGSKCACCGESKSEFLSIDHINGRKLELHRKGLTGRALYKWLRTRGFPKDNYQLLCYNCNGAKGYFGYCPHEREKMAAD